MRGALGQMGNVVNIIKDKPNLSGLLEAGNQPVQERGVHLRNQLLSQR